MSLVLHDYELDTGAYRARLLMKLLGLSWSSVPVDVFPGFEHQTDAFLAINPRGALPVLRDGGLVVRGTEAVLVHLAEAHDPSGTWLPREPAVRASVFEWLSFAGQELAAADAARLESMLGLPAPWPDAVARAHRALRILEAHLTLRSFAGASFLAGPAPTIADIACFAPVALAIDFQDALEDYPKLRAWTRRVRALPGFVVMPGIPEFL